MCETPGQTDALAALIAALRPGDRQPHQQATVNLQALSFLLEHHPEFREALRQALCTLLAESRQIPLYTDAGILANDGFGTTLLHRLGERALPMPYNPDSLRDRFGLLFSDKQDYLWLEAVPDATWHALWRAMAWQEAPRQDSARQTRLQLLESVQVLSARITAIGLEPELVRVCPEVERFASPFMHLSAEVQRYADGYRQALIDGVEPPEDEKQVLVLVEQCEAILGKVRKNAARYGISVNLTYHGLRLAQSIARLRALLELLSPEHDPAKRPQLFRLLVDFARAENRKYSLRDLFKSNTELLALQVTEHAGRHGEHYIAEDRREWSKMGKAAMGAGFIVGFMALIKLMLARGHLPLLWEGIAFGLNYAIGFIIVQILHYTIATKQPAMTAARLAAVLQAQYGRKQQLEELAELIVKVVRTQFVAIMGNVLLAIPTAALIALAWGALFGAPVVDAAKAHKLLHEIDPIHSLALPHAAIAGVFLFLSGLIAGYYDNKAIYRRIPERISGHRLLKRVLGENRAWRLGNYIEHNLGALAGNFYFGMFLGLTGTVGTILGLPLDIRHITFSSANLAFASVALDFQVPLSVVLLGCAGVALIGVVNLGVSFFLALWVALRSRKLSGSLLLPLIPMLAKRFLRRPLGFFLPPPPEPATAVDAPPADETRN
ncbi:probable site-specific recombinase [Chromobacterium violaceum ATCC 12472]|uniref:Probable site-specific recombinase n=1 Tax=Chromobacterium violaceum (strain ATCC 12472 / DSM 30191 / JCM 1249 / CCUG 213 / NBRC 12614 / NCIMB 9131 / NCTC 9757 / MK) TaxID=243365 RepID=Q7NV57_CHRVO|nr:probable site-specific recombinase [Chromobacterium violaceum ATCC 12472]